MVECLKNEYIYYLLALRLEFIPLGVHIITIHDGIFFTGPYEQAIQCFLKTSKIMEEKNLFTNIDKVHVLVNSLCPNIRQKISNRLPPSISLVPNEKIKMGLVAGGVPIGHRDFIKEFLREKVEELKGIIDNIDKAVTFGSFIGPLNHRIPARQAACTAIRLCIPAKFNYYIRTVDPDLIRPFATHLHTYMRKAYIKISTMALTWIASHKICNHLLI